MANPQSWVDQGTVDRLTKERPYFDERWSRGAAQLESPVADLGTEPLAATRVGAGIKKAREWAMTPTVYGDKRNVVQIYKAVSAAYQAEHPNAAPAEVFSKAAERAEWITRATETSSSPMDMSQFALRSKEVPFLNLTTMFTSKISKYRNVMDEAIQNARREPSKATGAKLAEAALLVGFNALAVAAVGYGAGEVRRGFAGSKKQEEQAKVNALWNGMAELAETGSLGGGEAVRSVQAAWQRQPPHADNIGAETFNQIVQASVGATRNYGEGKPGPAVQDTIRLSTEIARLAGIPADAPVAYGEGLLTAALGQSPFKDKSPAALTQEYADALKANQPVPKDVQQAIDEGRLATDVRAKAQKLAATPELVQQFEKLPFRNAVAFYKKQSPADQALLEQRMRNKWTEHKVPADKWWASLQLPGMWPGATNPVGAK
jgi:hypothetical protein